jgi:Oxidoreductase family, NAD-binding Rossmann fold
MKKSSSTPLAILPLACTPTIAQAQSYGEPMTAVKATSLTAMEMESVKILQETSQTLRRPVTAMQFGMGLHFDRTIKRHFAALRKQGVNARIAVGVDQAIARDAVMERMKVGDEGNPEELVFLTPDSPTALDARTEAQLNRLVAKHQINAVIVSVSAEAHFAFADWALRQGLALFLDKPITMRPNAIASLSAARGIADDYDELEQAYALAKSKGAACAVVNAQRPFIPVFGTSLGMVAEVLERTGQPVTNITASHADGQMRVGDELIDNPYHGFRNGYGKLGHSGYHLIDMVARYFHVGMAPEHRPDFLLVRSSLVQPDALVTAMPQDKWRKLFGETVDGGTTYSDPELIELGRRMGEIDAHVSVEAIKNGALITTANIHLQHNSVSARSSLQGISNWYKGSGRMKREAWHVDSGFAQSIRIETIQAEDKHDRPGDKGNGVGQPNHLNMVCVRNEHLVPNSKRFTMLEAADLVDACRGACRVPS